jgi:hypothetical protein
MSANSFLRRMRPDQGSFNFLGEIDQDAMKHGIHRRVSDLPQCDDSNDLN